MFINLLAAIVFTLVDFHIIGPMNGYTGISSKAIIFFGGILSTIPLSYFIGMAVSSITASTGSVAVGAVVNATFGSIIEILLYAFGLLNGKEQLVQGAIIGSFLLGLLALPGVAMFFGGLRHQEQRFNAKSASVTSTMLVVSVIVAFTPTIFQSIHGSYQFECTDCPLPETIPKDGNSCKSCRYSQPHPTEDPVYHSSTKYLIILCSVMLVLSYAIGLLFTLRTHNHKIYGNHKKKRRSKKRAVDNHKNSGRPSSEPLRTKSPEIHSSRIGSSSKGKPPIGYPIHTDLPFLKPSVKGRSHEKAPSSRPISPTLSLEALSSDSSLEDMEVGGHDGPGWPIVKSATVLLVCTIAYSMIAEILIDAIDSIIVTFPISEKTLGLTFFAIVPTVTEFCTLIYC